MTTRKKVVIENKIQPDLFDEIEFHEFSSAQQERQAQQKRRFCSPDVTELRIGSKPLNCYLRDANLQAPLIIDDILNDLDWSVFENRYSTTGRAPYAPRNMMGLILYGILQGKSSLRQIESLARLDLGAIWVSGGITPDHASIGRFITLHEDSITGDFFESLTSRILKETNSNGSHVAADGTTIEAASSHYKLIKAEAAHLAVIRAEKALKQAPECQKRQEKLEDAMAVEQELQHRMEKRKKRGKKADTVKMNPKEPEAVVQKAKRGRGFVASYTPSVTANEQRIVTGFAVDATSETNIMESMLEQSARSSGTQVQTLLVDAGYFHDDIIELALRKDINLLCPATSACSDKKKNDSKYKKHEFRYEETLNAYVCPAEERLIPVGQVRASLKTKGAVVYGGAPCETCSQKDRCTASKSGRRIKRHTQDEAREALRDIMNHPKAQREHSKRQAMVEPVFSVLRQIQGLNRFRRRGLAAVKREFGLHMLAYNLSRLIASLFFAFMYQFYCILGQKTRNQVNQRKVIYLKQFILGKYSFVS